MRKKEKLLLLTGLAVAAFSLPMQVCAEENESQIILNDESGIPDEVLYGEILMEGDSNYDGVLTKEEAANIKSLFAPRKEITDLTGIENLTGLKSLILVSNYITDIQPLEKLSNLHEVDLTDNDITDISPLTGLSNLEYLYLSSNHITDISGLGQLTNLEELYLDNNNITDINELGNISSLGNLNLNNNNITDISNFGNFSDIRYLWLAGNHISDIQALGENNQLSHTFWLDLSNNDIVDISPLAKILTKLSVLYLNNNRIEDVTPLKNARYLSSLCLDNNRITDITPLKEYLEKKVSKADDNNFGYYDEYNANGITIKRQRGYLTLSGNPISESMYREVVPESILNSKMRVKDGDPFGSSKNDITDESWLQAQLNNVGSGWEVVDAITYSWTTVDIVTYWYENGVRQGYDPENPDYRGKEIYDPESGAWYWLDNTQHGAVAKNKDVYQESSGGKWVRYDKNGHMIKGEDSYNGEKYRFDETTGAMIKGWYTTEDNKTYYYDEETGQMAHGVITVGDVACAFDKTTGVALNNRWNRENGTDYWYENGVRQGTTGRGKEIYDPLSDAWYWLDAVDNGKKAVSKDVYQESYAGKFADREDGTGKWVRYDEKGHMIKGWSTNENGTYYFDLETGAMAKGTAEIDGVEHYFNVDTGILER